MLADTLSSTRYRRAGRGHRPTPAARAYWRAEGHLVGQLLRRECALALPEIVTATRERLAETPEDGRFLTITADDVAAILDKLVGYGYAHGHSVATACGRAGAANCATPGSSAHTLSAARNRDRVASRSPGADLGPIGAT